MSRYVHVPGSGSRWETRHLSSFYRENHETYPWLFGVVLFFFPVFSHIPRINIFIHALKPYFKTTKADPKPWSFWLQAHPTPHFPIEHPREEVRTSGRHGPCYSYQSVEGDVCPEHYPEAQ